MKRALVLSIVSGLVLTANGAFGSACPSFNGKYRSVSSDGIASVGLQVQQTGCQKMTLIFEFPGFEFPQDLILDRRERSKLQTGAGQVIEKSWIDQKGILWVETRLHRTPSSGTQRQKYRLTSEGLLEQYWLDAQGRVTRRVLFERGRPAAIE